MTTSETAYTALRRGSIAIDPVQPLPASDGTLLREAAQGEALAFEELVGRYTQPLFNFLFRFLGNADDAADVTQLVWTQLFLWLPRLDPTQSLRSWLFAVARNKALDLLNKKRLVPFTHLQEAGAGDPDPLEEVADPSPLPDALLERQDLQHLLHQAIQALPVRYRTVVALRYTTDLTFSEIAQALGLPENTAKTLFHRAKFQLRAFLSQAP